MTVSKFRITADKLERRVHEAAKHSFNVTIVPAPVRKSMAGQMTYLQVMDCLRKGSIVGKPILRDDGLWEFRMERFASNQLFSIPVFALVEGVRVVELYVDLKTYIDQTGI